MRETASRYARNAVLPLVKRPLAFWAKYPFKNNAVVLAFLRRWRALCTPLFLLSNRTVFPIDFISLYHNYAIKHLRIVSEHEILQSRFFAQSEE